MGDKISGMPAATAPAATDEYEINQSGVTKRITPTLQHMRARLDNSISGNNITITTATTPALTLDNLIYDTGSFYSVSHPTRLTAPITGLYMISAQVQWANTSASGVRRLKIQQNGSADLGFADDGLTTHANQVYQTLTIMALLTAADYVEMKVNQTSGGNLDILQNDESLVFQIALIGP